MAPVDRSGHSAPGRLAHRFAGLLGGVGGQTATKEHFSRSFLTCVAGKTDPFIVI